MVTLKDAPIPGLIASIGAFAARDLISDLAPGYENIAAVGAGVLVFAALMVAIWLSPHNN